MHLRTHIAGVALAATVAGPAMAQSPAKPPAPTVVGVWRGTSTCMVRPSACNDEVVVFRISQMKTADSVAIDGRRIAGGQEVEMGILNCRFVPSPGQLTCIMPQGVWRFSIRGDSLTGELRRPDNTQVRDVRTKRAP